MSFGRGPDAVDALRRAKRHLDRLDLYPAEVRIDHVRVLVVTWLFALPYFRRFDGYALHGVILLRRPIGRGTSPRLVTHELCHVWQMQHHPIGMPLSYLVRGYRNNPYEREARAAAASLAGGELDAIDAAGRARAL